MTALQKLEKSLRETLLPDFRLKLYLQDRNQYDNSTYIESIHWAGDTRVFIYIQNNKKIVVGIGGTAYKDVSVKRKFTNFDEAIKYFQDELDKLNDLIARCCMELHTLNSMNLSFKVSKVSVMITNGPDIIYITPELPPSFPSMEYETPMKIECQKGYGETFCKDVLKLYDYTVIDTSKRLPGRYYVE